MAIEELEYDYNVHSRKPGEGLAVHFYMEALRDDDASVEQGRPIYRDVEMIEKRVRGDRNNIVQRPARPEDKREYRDAYAAFKDNADQAVVGTPLAQWPIIGKAMLEELKYLGFHTVEQLSEASDAVCSKMAGLQTYKQKALAYLEIAKGSTAPLEKLTAQVGDLLNQLEVMSRNNAEMATQLKVLQAKK